MEVKGKIKVIAQMVNVGTGTFSKRKLVVSTNETYPQHILISFVQDKCDLLDKFNVGESVTVGVNLRGREWVDPNGVTKYFNEIQGWNIKKEGIQTAPEVVPRDNFVPSVLPTNEEEDDLPF